MPRKQPPAGKALRGPCGSALAVHCPGGRYMALVFAAGHRDGPDDVLAESVIILTLRPAPDCARGCAGPRGSSGGRGASAPYALR